MNAGEGGDDLDVGEEEESAILLASDPKEWKVWNIPLRLRN
jgi:hypothetical protein